jgi:branched-chain amino acid aminotransferase
MKLIPTEVIWFDGKLVPWHEAQIHVLSHTLHYGGGVFEGLRAYNTPRGPGLVRLADHMTRMLHSCRIIGMELPYDAQALCNAVIETVSRNGLEEGYIRPIAFRGYGQLGVDPTGTPLSVIIAAWPLGGYFGEAAREKGIRMAVSSWRRMAPDTHPALAKAVGNYLNSQMIKLEARRHGYDDGIALDIDGYISEASGANIFLVREGEIWTPSIGSSILRGITRACVIKLARERGINVREERIPRSALYDTDEVFLSGSAAEVTAVVEIDGRKIGDGTFGPVARTLRDAYLDIVRGRVEDRFGWMTILPPVKKVAAGAPPKVRAPARTAAEKRAQARG